MNYFENYLKKKKLDHKTIENLMYYTNSYIKGTDDVCDYLHTLPKDTYIGLISDYDADGLLSEITKYLGLSLLGFKHLYISKRNISKGYEITKEDIDNLGNVDVIITSDVGINCIDAINYAKEKGMTVIVTDHHKANNLDLLNADYIINYRLDPDYIKENTDVCGAYTVYQILERYISKYADEFNEYDKIISDMKLIRNIVAIATVADAMPLVSINHHIVKKMLHTMNYINPYDKSDDIVAGICYNGILQNVYNNLHTFINALITSSYNDFDMTFLEYSVIPAINSVKRMNADTMDFYNMLFGTAETASENAQKFAELNEQRKELVNEKMDEIKEVEKENGTYKQPYGKYIYTTSAPISVLGLIATKVINENSLPAVVLNDKPIYDETLKAEVYKGSVRCPHSYQFSTNVNKSELAICSGHECECGISVYPEKLDDFYKFLESEFENMDFKESEYDIVKNKAAYIDNFDIYIDYDENIYDFENDMEKLVDDMAEFAPYGKGFEAPSILLSFSKKHGKFTPIKDNTHTKISLAPTVSCLIWNKTPEEIISADGSDTIYLKGRLSKSLYNGEWSINFIAETV